MEKLNFIIIDVGEYYDNSPYLYDWLWQSLISYLHTAWGKQLHIALMCSEAKPQECHRTKLIGNTLAEQKIDVAHIDEAGATKTQLQINQIIQVLTDEQPTLLSQEWLVTNNKKVGRSRKKYSFPGGNA